jgi:Transcriptional Coactivator p15 (PC4)
MMEHGEGAADDGIELATIPRGADRELRVRWRQFKGHDFVDGREWSAARDSGQWRPVKGKGITIKPRELEQVIDALEDARERATATRLAEQRAG